MYKIIAFIAGLIMLLTEVILFTNKKNVTNNVINITTIFQVFMKHLAHITLSSFRGTPEIGWLERD